MKELVKNAAGVPHEALHGDHQTGSAEAAATAPATALPLSARQGLMWVDDQLFPSARYHNLPVVLELRGALDVERLARAWHELVLAHDALRLSIDAQSPVQSFRSEDPPPLARIRLSAEELGPWVAQRSVRKMNQGGFLWDAALIEIAPERHVLYFCQDHSTADGISQLVWFDDLARRYGGADPQPAGAPFRDYLKAEASYRRSDRARVDKAYWDAKLGAGVPPLRPYGIARTDRSVALDRVWLDAGVPLAQRLAARAADPEFVGWSGQLSRFVVLATATAAFLRRVSGNGEVVLAAPFANRTPRFARTYGLFMQQLFLRIEVQEGDTFASLAQTVRNELGESVRHGQHCVSSRGVDYFSLNLLPPLPTRFADLSATLHLDPAPVRGGAGAGHGDLRDTLGLQVYDFADRTLELGFDFHAASFDARTQQRMCRHFVRVLQALADDPGARIDTVSLVDDEERRAVLRAARGREPDAPAPDVIEQFTAQARRRPAHVAVEGPDVTLDYAALDLASNRLARRLRALGVVRESRVGVAMPRGTLELVSLLATLKAGGAYVPIDASHPAARIAMILEDAAPQVLIAPATSPLVAVVPQSTQLLPLDDLAQATADWGDAPLDEPFAPEQLAYILFTSGSTGRPKGVEVPRGAFANFLRSMANVPGLSEGDRLLAITTTTFDIAGLELFLPLWVGATCAIADRETALDSRQLCALLERGTFSVMQATPATWRMLVDAGYRGDGRLRMFVGGEALSTELARQLLERGSELWNLYGPTETTVWSTAARIDRGDQRIAIGTPIDHTQVYLLDPALQLVPSGVVGEICIGGRGVARGYHGRPELTEQRFVPDPFGQPGARIYRTGDLGRLLEGGRLECLGRIDHQVKVRGFRIELGEIESALRGLPGVREVLVTARASGTADAQLVAYWVGEAERDALFERARKMLPHYMVPSGYVRLDAFPLTTSGKIDRKALPAPEPSQPQAGVLRLPQSDLEQRIAAIWSEVLGIAPIGVDQDFFALGGTSVMVIELRNRIERELGVEVPLRVFFEAPTVAGVAAQVHTPPSAEQQRCLVRLKPRGGDECLFLIHDGDGEVLLYRNLALQMPDDVSVYGVVPLAGRGLRMVHTSIHQMADHYVREIRARKPYGPYYLSGLCAGGVIAFEVARRLLHAGERVGMLALIDSAAPHAKQVALRTTRLRWRRFSNLVGELRSRGVLGVAAETQRRIANIADHEIGYIQRRMRANALTLLHENVYADSRRTWPSRLPVPSVRDVYLRALSRYRAEPIAGVPTLLFRATEGDGTNLPVRAQFEDPLFGWRELLGDSIEVVDIAGGHATMLQEGRVDAIAQRVRSAFERARASEAASRATDAQLTPAAGSASVAPGGAGAGAAGSVKPISVTVVIVNYRTALLVRRLLETVASERERGRTALDVRALIVDNASGEAAALRAAVAQHGWQSWATVIEAERNGGFAYGNNVCFAHAYASGHVPDFFFLLNPDTEVRPNAIAPLVRFMREHPSCGVAGSSLETEDGTPWPYAFRFPSLTSEVEKALGFSLATRLLESSVVTKRMGDQPEEIDWLPGASFMVRREVIDRLGGMDEGYFLYYEETDFCRKIKAAGFSVWYVPESRVMHIAGQSTGVTTPRAQALRLPDYWFESRRRYFAKQHGLPYAMATDVATLLAYAFGRTKLLLQGRSARAVPRYLLDLARHSALRARNRTIAPVREFRPRDASAPVEHDAHASARRA